LSLRSEHTFAIMAYKDSAFLPECIESVLSQTQKSDVILTTSTPSSYIFETAKKFGIEVKINTSKPSIATDWEFAAKCCSTQFFTLAHQDDIYLADYVERLLPKMQDAVIGFSDYAELRGGEVIEENRLMAVKKFLLLPIRIAKKFRSCFWKKSILRFGNPICCPSVMYNKELLSYPIFDKEYKDNLDWDAWVRAAESGGAFVYDSKKLILHRIHPDSETTRQIENSGRADEDLKMFSRLLPNWMAKIVFKFYKASYNSNKTE
jgi:hypothetical protein